jgi:dihydroxyacetone kinase-like protein
MVSISSEAINRWLHLCARTFAAHKDELTALDAAIGDGDHGANMARGFAAVPPKLDALAGPQIDGLFRATAMTLISQVGGASGPLYGTFFLKAAGPATGKLALTLPELCACLDAGLAGVVHLGKAALGDKTMVDVLTPALAALHPKNGDSTAAALDRAVAVAREAAEATIPLVAHKGRASYLGERSAGHKDPGAASSTLLLEALAEAAKT